MKEIEGTANVDVSTGGFGTFSLLATDLRRCPSSLTSKPSRFQCWGGRVKPSIRALPESRSLLVLVSCAHRSSETTPTALPFAVKRKSALSDRRETRYSLREVNMRSVEKGQYARGACLSARREKDVSAGEESYAQGSFTPFVTRSSTRTPIKPSARLRVSWSRPSAESPALIPANTPCAAASS